MHYFAPGLVIGFLGGASAAFFLHGKVLAAIADVKAEVQKITGAAAAAKKAL